MAYYCPNCRSKVDIRAGACPKCTRAIVPVSEIGLLRNDLSGVTDVRRRLDSNSDVSGGIDTTSVGFRLASLRVFKLAAMPDQPYIELGAIETQETNFQGGIDFMMLKQVEKLGGNAYFITGTRKKLWVTFVTAVALKVPWVDEARERIRAESQSEPEQSEGSRLKDESKICQYCAETIKAQAIKCKHCGSDLNTP